ncbi:proline-serine-threonine phosphatase-interacting protein 2 isoform X4 [Cyclopterus lumpus]|nr:proline-serine-threonine phosphatase-interacting protein 2 isoform X4 [Cyclopterus lumpus]
MFKLQTEHVSLSHLQLAQSMREEAKKLEEFRERQKEARKKMEQQMDALHKQKSSHFKKTMDSKKTYEQKCRDKEEADQNVNRNTNTNNTKHMEKLSTKAQNAKQTAEEADRLYHQNVTIVGRIRDEWQKEHVKACEMFEKQSVERINFLRNTVWTHLNQLSQQCVTSDELYEDVRKSLEQCNVQEDIEHFVNLRQTGDKPPAPVMYDNFYSGQRPPAVAPPTRLPPPIIRRGPLPDPTNNSKQSTQRCRTRGTALSNTSMQICWRSYWTSRAALQLRRYRSLISSSFYNQVAPDGNECHYICVHTYF